MGTAWPLWGLVGLVLALPCCREFRGSGSSAEGEPLGMDAWSWRLPPAQAVTRQRPLLLNYHHMALPDGRVSRKEDRLTLWKAA